MPLDLHAPANICCGEPIVFGFSSEERVSGRVRLTAGTEALPFRLDRDGVVSEPASSHRVRGKTGSYLIVDWGDHPVGTELVLRFEARKVWMVVS